MKISTMLNSIMNEPLALALIIGGVVLVAVAVILYIFLAHKKLMSFIRNKSAESAAGKEKRTKEKQSAMGLASGVFQERQKDEVKSQRKDVDADAAVNRVVAAGGAHAASAAKVEKPVERPKSTSLDPMATLRSISEDKNEKTKKGGK